MEGILHFSSSSSISTEVASNPFAALGGKKEPQQENKKEEWNEEGEFST